MKKSKNMLFSCVFQKICLLLANLHSACKNKHVVHIYSCNRSNNKILQKIGKSLLKSQNTIQRTDNFSQKNRNLWTFWRFFASTKVLNFGKKMQKIEIALLRRPFKFTDFSFPRRGYPP